MATIQSSIQLFDNASPALRSMSNALNICINSFESMQNTSKTGIDTNSIKQARNELAQVEINVKDIENNIELAKKQQDKFNSSINDGKSSVDKLKSGFMKIASTIGTVIGVNKILEASDAMVSINARLDMIKRDGEEVAEVQNKIFESAQRSRGSYQDTADAIGKMGIMAKDSFSSTDELVAFMEQINKQFVIAGTAPEGIKAGMLQLTQAMASGVLRGEELNSVFEQAPTIIQSIAEYMGKPIGEIRNLAKEGLITADIVKNAMFYTAEETNEKFENMPKTFGQIKTAMANEAQKAFQPVLQKINQVMSNDKFMNFTTNIMSAISKIASLSTTAFNGLIGLSDIIINNWDMITPILNGAIAILLTYNGMMLISTAITKAKTIAETAHAMALNGATKATIAMTIASKIFNATLLANPVFWVVTGVILLITILTLLCKWIAKTSDVAETGFGVFAGAFMTMLAVSANAVIGFINAIIKIVEQFITPIAGAIEWFVNAFTGGFDGIGGAFKNLLGKMINFLLGFAKIATPILDALFGTSFTDKISKLQSDIDSWGKNEKAVTWKVDLPTIDRISYKDAFNFGADLGDKFSNKISDIFKKDESSEDELEKIKKELEQSNAPDYQSLLGENIKAIDNNTSKLSDNLEIVDEDLSYMKDLAEREAINRFTTAEIKVEMTNNNKIDSTLDLDSIMHKLSTGLSEVLHTAREGI